MGASTHDGVTGSWLAMLLPPLGYVQSKFDSEAGLRFLRNYSYISIIGSVLYMIVIFGGRELMKNREPFSLRRPLILWNGGLAFFSVLGSLSIVPPLVHCLYLYGITYSVCHSKTFTDSQQTVWGFMFVLSKLVEFGDTVFIILRKKPLLFLHWYHHVTVCVYSFYVTGGINTDLGRWFGAMNYTVHTVMYTYYTLRAMGYYVPSKVALIITLMQLSQMFMGIYVNVVSYRLHLQGAECGIEPRLFYFGMAIYGSYALLFLNFFIRRYLIPFKKKAD